MRTHTVQLYDINELSEQAQEKAIDKLRELDYFGVESHDLTDQFKERLEEYGLPTDVEWSLGYSQGDGVAFYGDVDVPKLLKTIGEYDKYAYLIRRYEPSVTLTRNSWGYHYSHFNTMDVDGESREVAPREAEKWKELTALIELRVRSVSKELEKMGYDEIEYRQEKEQIIEMAEANEMEFREDGRLWHG